MEQDHNAGGSISEAAVATDKQNSENFDELALREKELSLREAELAEKEIELRSKELEAHENELSGSQSNQTKNWLSSLSPVLVALIGATLALLTNVVVSYQGAKKELDVERFKLQSSLILQTWESGDAELAGERLEFLARSGLIDSFKEPVLTYLRENEGQVPSIVTSGTSLLSGSQYVNDLPADDPGRRLSSATELIVGSTTGSGRTAWLISDEYLITVYDDNLKQIQQTEDLVLRMGYYTEGEYEEFELKQDPEEFSDKLKYAIFRVHGKPASKFGSIPIKVREPELEETLYILHHRNLRPLLISRGRDCYVQENKFTEETEYISIEETEYLFGHRCFTAGGSTGAPVIAASDDSILGLHIIGDPLDKAAVKMSQILEDSEFFQNWPRNDPRNLNTPFLLCDSLE